MPGHFSRAQEEDDSQLESLSDLCGSSLTLLTALSLQWSRNTVTSTTYGITLNSGDMSPLAILLVLTFGAG